jgi:hypothetical protein
MDKIQDTVKLWGLDVGKLRERARSAAWAATVAGLRSQVEDLKKTGVRIPGPDEPSGWAHNHVCPKCAVRLSFDRASEKEHRCPLCKGVFRSKDMNEAWIYILNLRQIQTASAACVLAAVDGNEAAADLAKSVLLGYARRYPEYPEHGRWAGKGRLQGQSLCEAVWMLPAVQVYRFLRENGRLTDAEAAEVREKMFVPAIQLLKKQTSQVHNIHVWHAAAILALADAAGRPDDVSFAEKIVKMNLEKGVLPDGSWYEGSPSYHFYTLEAMTQYVLAARAAGRPLLMPGQIRKMFASPVQLLLPDRTLPALNDGWSAFPLASRVSSYEMGQHLFGGFEGVLSTVYREWGAKRTDTAAFLYGPDAVPDAKIELKSLATVDGVAVVRRRGMTGLVKATPFGGGHDHPDKPGLYLFREGSGLKAADIGNCGYGNPMHKEYYRTTASHNTVMVDGKNQELAAAKIALAKESPEFTVVQALAEGAYKGVSIRRTAVFGDGWALDWTACRSKAEHSYLWLFHANGALLLLNEGLQFEAKSEPMVPNKHVSGQRRVKDLPPEIRGEWSERGGGKNRLSVQLWPAPGGQGNAAAGRFAGTAESPDLPASEQRGLLLAGGRAQNLEVVAFFCWDDPEGRPGFSARLLAATPERIEVEVSPAAGGAKPLVLAISSSGQVEVAAGPRN